MKRNLAFLSIMMVLGCLGGSQDYALEPASPGNDGVYSLWDRDFRISYESGEIINIINESRKSRIEVNIIRNTDSGAALEAAGDRLDMFYSVFEPHKPDYPGQFTQYIECPKEFKPIYTETHDGEGWLKSYTGFANSNRVAGACSIDLVAYKYLYGFRYCRETSTLYEINFFAGLEDMQAIPRFISEIKCGNTEKPDAKPAWRPENRVEETSLMNLDLSCPNCSLVLLNIELLRADHVGLINPLVNLTPNLDRFFRDAIIFADASAPSGMTNPSNRMILTSEQFRSDAKPENTIGNTLSENGYHTININEGPNSGRLMGFQEGIDDFIDIPNRVGLVKHSIRILKEKTLRQKGRRFFMLYHPNMLHPPFIYINSSLYNGDYGSPEFEKRRRSFGHSRKGYESMLSYFDESLGETLQSFEDELGDSVIYVLYSNHGDGLGDNGVPVGVHGVSYQSCIHVPLLIRHPKAKEKIIIHTPVWMIDFAPTIYDMLGVRGPQSVKGVSLVELIGGGGYNRTFMFGYGNFEMDNIYVRRSDLKMIYKPPNTYELYNLSADPGETVDIIGDNSHLAGEFKARILEIELTGNLKR